jgi:hypothetical protein
MYEKILTEKKKEILICMHPDCNHKILTGPITVLHKRAACFICGDSFIISHTTLKLKKWRCDECRKGKPKVRAQLANPQAISDLIEEIGLNE